MTTLLGHWWNGQFGKNVRRDIWLYGSESWVVEFRHGDSHSPVKRWQFGDEASAFEAIDQLIQTNGDGWQRAG
jgi:hypothetical protein